jgi:diacylglycerol kinase (ATP)
MNPVAGAPGLLVQVAVRERCEAALEHLTTLHTTAADRTVSMVAQAVAADGALDLIVVAGGDGTVCEVAEGLARGLDRWPGGDGGAGTAALCLIPGGSGNSAYYELCGRRAWEEMLDLALAPGDDARIRQIDLVRVVDSDRASLLGVNAGLIAHIAEQLERRKREDRRRGETVEASATDDEQRYWAAFGEALQAFRPFPVRVSVDGDELYEGTVMMVTVGGVRGFGRGNFQLLPRSVLDDGLLDVCVVREVGLESLTELAGLVRTGAHLERPEIAYAQGEHVTVERLDGEPLALEHDGDPRPAGSRVDLRVIPGAVPVVVPR